MDFVQWTGAAPVPDSDNWQQLDFKYDVYGRRSKKLVDGRATRYLYDGPHVIAEYDGNNNLLRKYIYGPGVDQPVSMIEVADSNATYYYHYDALGSVIALSDSSGDTVQTYEYSVFGEPAVEDANHTNPYMFAGRRYDIEIGLYYNRARYYNPYTGRFLQTDPSGYSDGMNWYAYCGSNPINVTDPSGTTGVYLDPELEYRIGDSNMYYEWTGDWKITNWRGERRGIAIFNGSLSKRGNSIKSILKIGGVIKTSYHGAKLIFDKSLKSGYALVAGFMIDCYIKQISVIGISVLDNLRRNVQDGYRAWIKVRAYKWKVRKLWWDGWAEGWPAGSDEGWIEVKGGDGYSELQGKGRGVYGDPVDAMNAIKEAVSEYMRPRPGD